jgi:osmotically inducible protein OsmC
MAFSFACEKAGFRTEKVETQALVSLSPQGIGFFIDRIMLRLKAVVPGMPEGRFQEIALTAKRNCPLSQALAGVPEIGLEAKLEEIQLRQDEIS